MDGEAGGQSSAAPTSSPGDEAIAAVRDAHIATGSEDDDCDDLYGDVNVGFLALLPLSPSPAPTSPPKTPSLGPTPSPSRPPGPHPDLPISPSPPPTSQPKTPSPGLTLSPFRSPHRAQAPEPRPVHEPKPSASATQYEPPRAPPPAARRHQMTPPGRALYISELPWWATDAEVEAALALVPRAASALRSLFFYSDKVTGKSRGICRADFVSPDAAASAATALHGRAFHRHNCVASLSRPPALNRLSKDSKTSPVKAAPNPSRGRGNLGPDRGATNAPPVRGNVGPILADRPALAPHQQPSMAPWPHGLPFGGTMGGGGGYDGYQLGQFNAGMHTGMMPSAVAPHLNPAFLAAGGRGMHGLGVWPDHAMDGNFWGAQPPWNFGGCQLPWQQPALAMQAQEQQQDADGNYGKGRGMRRGGPEGSDERGIGNVQSYPEGRQSDRDEDGLYKGHDREERSRHRDRPEKERETERYWDEEDRRRGNRRRYQEYSEDDDDDRTVRSRAKSQSRNDDNDDHPRRHR